MGGLLQVQREFMLVCSYCDEYTLLGRYLPKEGRFQGEHSIVHNRHTESDALLCKFLVSHVGHPVRLVPDRTDEYTSALARLTRFAEDDIDRYVLEATLAADERQRDLDFDRGLGQLQLLILRQMLGHEAEVVSRTPGQHPADSQFLLGKQQALEWASQTVEEIIRKGSPGGQRREAG